MADLLSIGKAAAYLGVSIQTLRNWDKKKILLPDEVTRNGGRRYSHDTIKKIEKEMSAQPTMQIQQDDDLIELTQRMKFAMKELGLNIFTLSEKMFNFGNYEAEPQYIYDILNAKKVPNLKFLNTFADLLFIDKNWLFDGSRCPFGRKFIEMSDVAVHAPSDFFENFAAFLATNNIKKVYLILDKDAVKKEGGLSHALLILEKDGKIFQKISNSFYVSENFGSTGSNALVQLYKIRHEIDFREVDAENWQLLNSGECYIGNVLESTMISYMLDDLFDFNMSVKQYPKAIQESRRILEYFYNKKDIK